jgi:hypothetical protein
MDIYLDLASTAAGFIYLVAGVRVCLLGLRNGQISDRLMGASLLLWGVSYFFYDLPYAAAGDESPVSPFFEVAWRVADYSADIAFAFFIKSVFRRQERWASWLVAGIATCLIVGAGGMTWAGEWEGTHLLSSPWYWLESVGIFTPSVWMATEGLTQYRKARQRRRLGLCTPLVCNRYLLWGLAGVLWGINELTVIPQASEFAITQAWSTSLGAFVTALDVTAVGMMWFVFFPPTFYRNWIDRRATVADAAEEGSPHGG